MSRGYFARGVIVRWVFVRGYMSGGYLSWYLSSDLLPLNDRDTPTLLHRSSPDISCSLYSCPFLLLGGASGPGFWPPTNPSIRLSLSGLSPQRASPFLQFLESSLGWLCLLLWLSLSFSRGILFPLLLLSSPLWHWMRPNLSAAWNALLKPGGLLRWKRLAKDARHSLPLTEVIKIARLTSPLLDAPLRSRPRLKHGRRLALLSHLGLTLNLCTLFFVLSLALLPRFPPLLTVLLGNRLRFMPLTWDLTFPFLSQRPCVAEPEATSISSAEPRALWSLTPFFSR